MHFYGDPPAIYDAQENTLIATCETWRDDKGEMVRNADVLAAAPELKEAAELFLIAMDKAATIPAAAFVGADIARLFNGAADKARQAIGKIQ